MSDSFSPAAAASPSLHFYEVTPSNDTDLPRLPKGLYIGGGDGTLEVHNFDGSAVTFVGVPVGSILPIRAKRVLATGTGATNIVALA